MFLGKLSKYKVIMWSLIPLNYYSYTDPFPPKQINYKWKKKFTETVGGNLIFNQNILGAVPGHLAPIECVLHLSE